VLKEISPTEGRTFCHISEAYFGYMKSIFFDEIPSTLVPILGLFEVFQKKDGQAQLFLLMPNLFGGPGQRPELVFDLKGKRHGRYVDDSAKGPRCSTASPWVSGSVPSLNPELPTSRTVAISMDEASVLPASQDSASCPVEMHSTGPADDSEQVLLDENFASYTLGQPLPLIPEHALVLQRAFENDANLLCKLGIMDYSILVRAL
jgi:hypothetical protein